LPRESRPAVAVGATVHSHATHAHRALTDLTTDDTDQTLRHLHPGSLMAATVPLLCLVG